MNPDSLSAKGLRGFLNQKLACSTEMGIGGMNVNMGGGGRCAVSIKYEGKKGGPSLRLAVAHSF